MKLWPLSFSQGKDQSLTLDMLYIIVDMSAWCRLSVDLDVHQRIPSWSWQYDALRLSSKEVLEVGVAASMFRGVVAWPSRIAMAIMAISTISPWTSILLRLAQGFQWQRKHQSLDALQNKKLECVLTKVTVVPPSYGRCRRTCAVWVPGDLLP